MSQTDRNKLSTSEGETAPFQLDEISYIGSGLARPECVLCTRAGDIFASDRRGGISHIKADKTQALYLGQSADLTTPLFPNGFALDPDGSFLIAHLDSSDGGVFRLRRDGDLRPVLREANGVAFTTTNFVLLDHQARLWITISTRRVPRDLSYRLGVDDGFIVLLDDTGARIVADGLGFANEVRISPDGNWLYVNETYSRRLSRYRILPNSNLGPRETFVEFGHGIFPDGLAFDIENTIWITSVVSNRLLRVLPNGHVLQYLEDCDLDHIQAVETAYLAGRMGRSEIDKITSQKLKSISSIAFGGPDRRTAYLGVLLGDALPVLRMPVEGAPMAHWNF